MIHLQQILAHHWHFSASQYWQLRLLCAIALGPLAGVLYALLFSKNARTGAGTQRVRRFIRTSTLRHPASPRPSLPAAG
jgi:hypothetical protein